MVSRNLERANENDGFKMTALEVKIVKPKLFITISVTAYYMKPWPFVPYYKYDLRLWSTVTFPA